MWELARAPVDSRAFCRTCFHIRLASWHAPNLTFLSGFASSSRGEGAKVKGSRERGGVVETEGPSPHDSPAREGSSDRSSPNCTAGGKKHVCLLNTHEGSSPDHHRSPKSIFTAINLWENSRSLLIWVNLLTSITISTASDCNRSPCNLEQIKVSHLKRT